MKDNVVKLNTITKLDITASDMLNDIAESNPEGAFVIVWPEDGSEPTFHSSVANIETVMFRLNEFIHLVYKGQVGDRYI